MGERVVWEYSQRYFNNTSKTRVQKRGVFLGKIRHTKRYYGPQLALVRFDYNARPSKVPYSDLIFIDGEQGG